MLEAQISFSDLKHILCYPLYKEEEFKKRVNTLNSYGIKLLNFGKSKINNINILGKGHAAVVLKGLMNDREVAVKLRRIDSKRDTMLKEAYNLKIANSIRIAPKLFYANDEMLIMEYIEGNTIRELIEEGAIDTIKVASRYILEKCFMLDLIGLDHGELSRMDKHIIIKDRVEIIDFDSASFRKVSNLTSAIQYLIKNKIYSIDGFELLREYKVCVCKECFKNILSALKVI